MTESHPRVVRLPSAMCYGCAQPYVVGAGTKRHASHSSQLLTLSRRRFFHWHRGPTKRELVLVRMIEALQVERDRALEAATHRLSHP